MVESTPMFFRGARNLEENLLKEMGTYDAGAEHTGSFEYVIAIRMPRHAAKKKKEQELFAKYMKENWEGKTCKDFLMGMVEEGHKKLVKLDFGGADENSLEGTLNCLIGMLLGLFDTLASSHKAEIDVMRFSSIEINKIFICTRMSCELSEVLADMAEYPVQLSQEGIGKLGIKLTKDLDTLVPAFVKYDKGQKDRGLLVTTEHATKKVHVLRHIDRIRLMYDKMTDYLKLNEIANVFQPMKITFKMFVCHDAAEIRKLQAKWAAWKFVFQLEPPFDDIREYFGEGQALYFLFTNHVQKFLLLLLPAAVPTYIVNKAVAGMSWEDGGWIDDTFHWIFHVYLVVWIVCLKKYWKRKEAFYANRWGTDFTHVNMSVKDVVNHEFEGKPLPSNSDENIMEYRVKRKQRLRALIYSTVVTAAVMLFVVVVIAGMEIAAAEKLLPWPFNANFAIVLAVLIKVFATLYNTVAVELTRQEQHPFLRARAQYFGVKNFAFTFFNTFFGFYWIAFARQHFSPGSCQDADGIDQPSCHYILKHTLIMAFPTLIVLIGLGIAKPFAQIKYKYVKQKGDLEKELPGQTIYQISMFEQQTKMLEYTDDDQTQDFLEIFTPLCFVALFSVIAPAEITILAAIQVTLQQRADALRCCVLYQRMFPARVATIGVWNPILKFVTMACVINVSALFAKEYYTYFDWCFPGVQQAFAALDKDKAKHASPQTADVAIEKSLHFLVMVAIFCITYFSFMLFAVVFDTILPDMDSFTHQEKERQVRQRAVLFEAEEGDFEENVRLEGSANWQKPGQRFHEIGRLEPGNPMYVDPVMF